MGKKMEEKRHKKHEKRQNKKQRKEEKKEHKKEHKKEKRDERHENMKDFFQDVAQIGEDVVDTVWQGETDKQKDKRQQTEKVEAEEFKQTCFDWTMYIGVGLVLVVAVMYMWKK